MFRRDDIAVVGAGRWLRKDDQIGLIIAERLRTRSIAGVTILTTESPGADIATGVDGVQLLILVDAAEPDSSHSPGSWRRIDLSRSQAPIRGRSWQSSHTLGVDVALQMCRHLGSLPECVCVYAIAIADADYGEAVTPQVEAALGPVLGAIEREITQWRCRGHHVAATESGVKGMAHGPNASHDSASDPEGIEHA